PYVRKPERRSYSTTTISPFIPPCPIPQNFAHLNGNVPALVGVNFTVCGSSLLNTTFSIPRSFCSKPCFVSSLWKVISTGWPTFSSMCDGLNSNFFAMTVIFFGSEDGAGAASCAFRRYAPQRAAARTDASITGLRMSFLLPDRTVYILDQARRGA